MAKRTGGFIGQDGINAPDPATGVTGTAGDGQVTVSWTNPSDVGGAAITNYVISSNPSVPIDPPSLTTASYTSKSFSLESQGSGDIHYGMTFNSDGTKAYFTGYGAASIFQYSLSTAWDISTTSYDNVTLSTSGQTSSGQSGLVFSPDGTKLYMVSYSTDTVYQYTLTTPFDLSTGSYANKSLSVSSQDSNPQDMYIKSDGTKLYVLGDTNNSVFQYSMSTPFDLATASYDSVSFATTSQQTNPTGLFFSSDGTIMLVCGYTPVQADKYILSTPWVVSSASHDSSYTVSEFSSGDYPNAIFAGNDLNNLFVSGGVSGNTVGKVFQYAVGMPTGSPFVYGGLTNGTSYTFNVWAINPFGWSTASDASGSLTPEGARGLFAGTVGNGSTQADTIEYIVIDSAGNSTDFGDLTGARTNVASGQTGSTTRGLFGGGRTTNAQQNIIDYVTIASAGNATDFGDLITAVQQNASLSNGTRAIYSGGFPGTNVIQYVTIASAGNATDFGDLIAATRGHTGIASTTRGLFAGGRDTGPNAANNRIQYITIASTGNATDFGDLLSVFNDGASCSSGTRGIIAGNAASEANSVVIQYVTIASTGNATDFGDLSTSRYSFAGASNTTRGVFAGGKSLADGTKYDYMDYITIASTGNTIDFGDLSATSVPYGSCSNGHGGLS